MFKRVKSLMIAGLLVMGMSGNVFADEESTCILPSNGTHDHSTGVHTIEYDEAINDEEVDKLIDEINTGNKYYIAEETTGEDDVVRTISVYFDGNCDGDHTDEFDELIEIIVIEVNNNVGDTVDKGWEDILLIPKTGDAIALGGLGVAGVAAIALAINNKKKNK